jgi:hypothetical protein
MCGQLMPTALQWARSSGRESALTQRTAEQLGEPVIHIHAQMSDAMERLANFLQRNRAETVEHPATGAFGLASP